MIPHYRTRITNGLSFVLVALSMCLPARSQERSVGKLLDALWAELQPASTSQVNTAKLQTEEALRSLNVALATQALGVILSPELQLERLGSELGKVQPDVPALRSIERALRRLLPGKLQPATDQLRQRVASLARLLSLTPAGVERARQAITTIRAHSQNELWRQTRDGERQLRQAFADLQAYHPSIRDIEAIRSRLSIANYSSLIKREFLETVAQREFEIPVHFHDCQDGTAIAATGQVRVALCLELPVSSGESQLLFHVTGSGPIHVSADRQRIHVGAQVQPDVHGLQRLHLWPEKIAGDSPAVDARLSTRLTQIDIDGLLGRLKVTEKLASRIFRRRLDAAEGPLADQIERTARERVEEASYDIAYRINGLIKQGVWDRIRSLDFKPEVHLQNDAAGIRTATQVVGENQLGALSPQPTIPLSEYHELDLISWIHESAVNNIFDSLSEFRLDEATMRGLLETELKLTCDDWHNRPPARIPAVITMADESPLQLRFVTTGVEVRLRAKACEVDGRVVDAVVREFTLSYRLESDAQGTLFTRQAIAFPHELSAAQIAIWTETLDLYFGQTMRPAPKFRNSSFPDFLRLGYVSFSEGWLVVGASRGVSTSSPLAPLPEEIAP